MGASRVPPGLRHELRAVGALWRREYLIFLREHSRLVASVATPLLWVVFVGTGFGASFEPVAGIPYRTWLFPGVIAQAVLFSSVFFGLYIVWDRKVDVLKAILVAPVSRLSIFSGKVLGGATEAAMQGTLLLLIGVIFFGVTPAGLLLALPIVLLLAVGFVSVGLGIGSCFDSFEGFHVIVSFMLFPLFFISGALFPVAPLQASYPWLYVLVRLNPVTYAVDALRGATLGLGTFPYLYDVTLLVLFAAAALGVGTLLFRRMR